MNGVAGHFPSETRLDCSTPVPQIIGGTTSHFIFLTAQATPKALEYGPHERQAGQLRLSGGSQRAGLETAGSTPVITLRLLSVADQMTGPVSSQKTSGELGLYVSPCCIILPEQKQTLGVTGSWRVSCLAEKKMPGRMTYTQPNMKSAMMLDFSKRGRWSLWICPACRRCSVGAPARRTGRWTHRQESP